MCWRAWCGFEPSARTIKFARDIQGDVLGILCLKSSPTQLLHLLGSYWYSNALLCCTIVCTSVGGYSDSTCWRILNACIHCVLRKVTVIFGMFSQLIMTKWKRYFWSLNLNPAAIALWSYLFGDSISYPNVSHLSLWFHLTSNFVDHDEADWLIWALNSISTTNCFRLYFNSTSPEIRMVRLFQENHNLECITFQGTPNCQQVRTGHSPVPVCICDTGSCKNSDGSWWEFVWLYLAISTVHIQQYVCTMISHAKFALHLDSDFATWLLKLIWSECYIPTTSK